MKWFAIHWIREKRHNDVIPGTEADNVLNVFICAVMHGVGSTKAYRHQTLLFLSLGGSFTPFPWDFWIISLNNFTLLLSILFSH